MRKTKHEPLTIGEVEQYQLPAWLPDLIATSARQFGLAPNQVRILDWGCGRGLVVLKLLQLGFDAWGVDIDAKVLAKGGDCLAAMGYRDRLVRARPEDFSTTLPSGFFHLIFSRQVLEHVSDLTLAFREMRRLNPPGALGYHVFPAKWRVMESHLRIPLVHWLPKNNSRRLFIWCFQWALPPWAEVGQMSAWNRAAVFYRYSVGKTYYRSAAEIARACRDSHFSIRPIFIAEGGRISTRPPRGPGDRFRRYLSNTFRSVRLYVVAG